MSDKSELEHFQELIQAHKRRLRVLEIEKARKGIDCPPQIQEEIKDIETQISNLTSIIQSINALEDNTKQSSSKSISHLTGEWLLYCSYEEGEMKCIVSLIEINGKTHGAMIVYDKKSEGYEFVVEENLECDVRNGYLRIEAVDCRVISVDPDIATLDDNGSYVLDVFYGTIINKNLIEGFLKYKDDNTASFKMGRAFVL